MVAYLFFASGVHNFAKLPTLVENVGTLDAFETHDGEIVRLEDQITVLGFLGKNLQGTQGNAFNLNQKIYKKNHEFRDFQFVMIVPQGSKSEVKQLMAELEVITDVSGWKFLYGTPEQIQRFHKSLQVPYALDESLATPYVFIIDKNRNLRGRDDSREGEDMQFGYNSSSVAELNDSMTDDIKVILAEYRLALKKYKADRSN